MGSYFSVCVHLRYTQSTHLVMGLIYKYTIAVAVRSILIYNSYLADRTFENYAATCGLRCVVTERLP